jgi:hypothetical protein
MGERTRELDSEADLGIFGFGVPAATSAGCGPCRGTAGNEARLAAASARSCACRPSKNEIEEALRRPCSSIVFLLEKPIHAMFWSSLSRQTRPHTDTLWGCSLPLRPDQKSAKLYTTCPHSAQMIPLCPVQISTIRITVTEVG